MSSLGWLYGILQGHKIDTDGMTPKEAFDKLDELQKAGKLTDSEAKTCEERRKKTLPTKKVVKVKMDAEVQKQLEAAKTPKERQQIAFRYIMDNLRGQYEAPDGRTVAIERVGADKMTYQDNLDKLRVCPALADMIKAGEYDHSAAAEEKANKKFVEFAYYRVRVRMGDETYAGMLNVGIRKDGSSTLYDLRPFHKEDK
ncbi:MAG: hypothetical protein NC184_05660 [Roseburia sp.]|nr:hypothetical protein [Roseburia sp.]